MIYEPSESAWVEHLRRANNFSTFPLVVVVECTKRAALRLLVANPRNPKTGICNAIAELQGEFLGAACYSLVRILLMKYAPSVQERDYPVGGLKEYRSSNHLWDNPKRHQLLRILVWELERMLKLAYYNDIHLLTVPNYWKIQHHGQEW